MCEARAVATRLRRVYAVRGVLDKLVGDRCLGKISLNYIDKHGLLQRIGKSLTVAWLALGLAACALTPSAGPTTRTIGKNSGAALDESTIAVVDVSNELAHRLVANAKVPQFSEVLGEGQPVGTLIGRGDVLDISIWEAPPAALFGAISSDSRGSGSSSTSRGASLPEQVVDNEGRVFVPFIGAITVAGLTPDRVEAIIVSRLAGKAHQPQVLVRVAQNTNRTVTVVGEFSNSGRIPLGPRGERLLDVLALVGGTRHPVAKTTIQIARDSRLVRMPLDAVISDPQQNIRLQPGDIVTALFQPFSFTALGATGRNEEIPFESTGLTLSQALGRAQGLQDSRADAKGVFIFRLEPAELLAGESGVLVKPLPNGTVPVIYRVNLKDPRSLFVAQTFPIRDKDILYVSNAPIADIQKFVNVIYSSMLPIVTAATVVP